MDLYRERVAKHGVNLCLGWLATALTLYPASISTIYRSRIQDYTCMVDCYSFHTSFLVCGCYLCIAASAKVNYQYVCGWTKETQFPILSCIHEKTIHGLLSTSDHMTCKWQGYLSLPDMYDPYSPARLCQMQPMKCHVSCTWLGYDICFWPIKYSSSLPHLYF